MARPEKCRLVFQPPKMKGFQPFGLKSSNIGVVKLKFDEYESIKMIDYDNLSHISAANKMNVSRPTFTRLYNKALKKIAKALVEGCSIEIEGGNYLLNTDWYRCNRCNKLIEGLENHVKCKNCPKFSSNELINLNLKSENKFYNLLSDK